MQGTYENLGIRWPLSIPLDDKGNTFVAECLSLRTILQRSTWHRDYGWGDRVRCPSTAATVTAQDSSSRKAD